jgi:transglutaminase-like putative cysteine protease
MRGFGFSTRNFFVIIGSEMQKAAFQSRFTRTIACRLWLACRLFVLLATIPVRADDNAEVNYGPPSSWVKPQFFNRNASASLADAGADDYLLLQEQQFNALQNEAFFHTDRQILTVGGVQDGSTIKIEFNPNYQSLTFHWVRVWRGAQYLDRLDTNKVEIVQQEKDMDQYMLNGEKSFILVLDDVRVGDIIDYSYSLKGENPVFDTHFNCVVPVQMDQPADRMFTRVLWPRQKALYAKQHGCSVQPALVAGKEADEFTWDFRRVPGAAIEDSLPGWYDPIQWVQLSDFRTWAEVNQWALKLFQIDSPFSPDLSQRIAEWKQIDGREQQVLAVLRFIQDDVRYFGIEMGISAERPTSPSVVFSRRFGDCKDKSLLFVTILRALGIEAWPVMVNSTLGRGIEDWQPSAGAFDHCIAQVQCDGQTYWLDPTINYQRGPLAAHYLPPYGYGLVIAPGSVGLTPIPQTTGLPRTTTTEYFQLRGVAEPSDLKVVTLAEGRDADALRELFATTKLTDIQRVYTHFYSTIYPGIKMSSPIVTEDDEDQNTFQTTEDYSIDDLWTQSDKNRKYSCQFYPSTISTFLAKPVDTDRSQPLGITFPEHYILRTEVNTLAPLPYSPSDRTISDPAFTFRKSGGCVGNKLIMEYEYQSLADSVSPDEAGDYLQRLDQCSQLLGDTLTWR